VLSRPLKVIPQSARALVRLAVLTFALSCIELPGALARPVPEPPTPDFEEQPLQIAQRGGVSLQQAVRMATRRYEGRVVRAVTVDNGGRRVHEIRILQSEGGRVVTVRIDAQTGETR
jgi:hypothetical protein